MTLLCELQLEHMQLSTPIKDGGDRWILYQPAILSNISNINKKYIAHNSSFYKNGMHWVIFQHDNVVLQSDYQDISIDRKMLCLMFRCFFSLEEGEQ